MEQKKNSLKKKLFDFWDSSKEYYDYARSLNINLPEERRETLKYVPANALVLDVASGSCENGLYISKSAKYVGADISRTALRMAKDFQNDNFELVRTDVETLPFCSEKFDVVISTFSLEHFTNPKKVIAEMHRVCKTGGRIIILSAAFDFPFDFYPNFPDEFKTLPRKIQHSARHLINQLMIYLNFKFSPTLIRNPAVLREKYSQDNDTVYVVYTLEVKKYLQILGCKIIYLRRGKNWFHKLPFATYWFTSLFVIAEKNYE